MTENKEWYEYLNWFRGVKEVESYRDGDEDDDDDDYDDDDDVEDE